MPRENSPEDAPSRWGGAPSGRTGETGQAGAVAQATPAPCPLAPGNEDFRCWGREWWGNSPPVPPAGGEQTALGYLWGGDPGGGVLNDRQKLLPFPLAFWPQARLKYPQSHQQHTWGRSLELGTTGKPGWEKAAEEQKSQ